MTQFTCKVSNRSITGYHLNTFTICISLRFSSAREFQMGNFQKYWSQNVGQDFIVLDFLVGGRLWGRKRCVREINVSRAWDPVHAGDKALTRETPAKRGRVNRYENTLVISEKHKNTLVISEKHREQADDIWKHTKYSFKLQTQVVKYKLFRLHLDHAKIRL